MTFRAPRSALLAAVPFDIDDYVFELACLQDLAREMNKAFGGFAQKLLFHGTVDAKLRELVILRIGWNCQAVGYPASGGSAFDGNPGSAVAPPLEVSE